MDVSRNHVVNVLAREGEYWTVVFGDRVSRVRDAKGLHYLDHLLRHPGEEFHALTLVAVVEPPSPAGRSVSPASDDLAMVTLGDAGPVLDAAAVAAYRQRFRDLQDELADAEQCSDHARLSRAQDELDALTEQLAGGLGLGGRHRRAGSPTERARLAVTKAIRSAIRRLEQADPELGRHLDRTVRTGTFCAYSPDPALQVVWQDKAGRAATDQSAPTTARPARQRAEPGRRRTPRTTFVGRPLERGLMIELVAAAAAGRGGLLLISGEAGIGKTRLTEEALLEAEARAMGTFVGRCLEGETALAWLPLVEVLEQLADELDDERLLDLLGGGGPEVARVLPSLRRRFPDLPPPLDLPGEQARQFLYATIRDLLLRLGSIRPAVLVLEDIHWADPATLNMLQNVVDGLEDARVLLIATYRSDEAPLGSPLARTVERLVRHPACATLALGPFDVTEVGDLIAKLTGRTPPAALSSRLWNEADGNPFFVEELLKHLTAEKHLFAENGEFRADLGPGALAVPAGLRLVLGHRLQRLSNACRGLLNLAAVAGRDVDLDLLVAASGGSEDSVMEAVEEAMASGVLVARGASDDERLGFSHALLRQAALAELSTIRRRRLHMQVADALRRRYGEDPQYAGEVADHLERAGSNADGITLLRFLELAAQRSLESAAYEDAFDRFRRALPLVPANDRRRRASLLAGLGYGQRGMGSPDEANATWLEALDLLEEGAGDDTALIAELSRALGRYLDATGGLDAAIAVLERGLRAVGDKSPTERSRLLSALGYVRALDGDHEAAAASVGEASQIAEALDDDRLRADVLASQTSLAFTAGCLRECIESADAAERALVASGQVWDAVQAQVTTAWPRLWLGRVEEARRMVNHILPTAERIGHVPAVFLSRRSTALVDLLTSGNADRFDAQAAASVRFCRENRLRWLADAQVFAGLAKFWTGDWDAAADHLRTAATAPAPPVYAGRYSATLLTFLAWTGDVAAFDRLEDELRSTFARSGLQHTLGTMAVTLAAVEGHALLGRTQAAAELYPAISALLDTGLVLRPPDLRIVHALAGVAAGLGGNRTAADTHFVEARRLVQTLPHPRHAPDIDFLQALALTDDGQPAKTLLEDAMAGYERFGMTRHRERAGLALAALARPTRSAEGTAT